MKIVVVTIGTQGDVLPMVAVGARLQAAGHEVTLGTQELFAAEVREAGLEFRPIPGDCRALLASDVGRAWREARSTAAANRAALQVALQMQSDLTAGIVAAAQGADLLITNYISEVHGYLLARAMGIPFLSLHLFPCVPTAAFLPAMVGTFSLGGWANKRVARWGARIPTSLDAGIATFQRELGLPKASVGAVRLALMDDPVVPIANSYSQAIVARPADWRPGIEVIGFCWPLASADRQPDARLVDFLESGPPPVYAGLGSMAVGDDSERLSEIFTGALRAAGVRGVIQSGWADLSATDNDDILTIGGVSHDWLFPRTAAVVSHAGSGTTGTVLRSGVPLVPVPMLLDQKFWAARAARIGVSPGSAPFQTLTTERLATLIRQAVTEPAYRKRAEEVAVQVGAEDGTGAIAAMVERIAVTARPA